MHFIWYYLLLYLKVYEGKLFAAGGTPLRSPAAVWRNLQAGEDACERDRTNSARMREGRTRKIGLRQGQGWRRRSIRTLPGLPSFTV
jgi:hypothetical protein